MSLHFEYGILYLSGVMEDRMALRNSGGVPVPRVVTLFRRGDVVGTYLVPGSVTTWEAYRGWLRGMRVFCVGGERLRKVNYCVQCGHVEVA